MNKIKENLNLIIGLLTFLFIGFIIYNSFFKEDKVGSIEEVIIGEMDTETRKIIEVLDKIDGIKIDGSFFNKSPNNDGYSLTFNELEDFSQPIPNKRPGKVNPFVKGGAISYLDESSDSDDEIKSDENVENVVQQEIIEN